MMKNNVIELTCNDAVNPLGIDSSPTFSWKYVLQEGSGSQRAYRVCVASRHANLTSGVYDCWDSGKIESAQSQFVTYDGAPLTPRTSYYWMVTVYGEDDNSCTEQATFETGKLDEKWSAKWIACDHHRQPDAALDAPYLRKSFAIDKQAVCGRLYIYSPGYFDAYINGERISEEELPTPFTKFDSRLLYCTYDVTDLLQPKDNAIGVLIGNGWYNCFTEDVWNSRQTSWRHIPKLIAELYLTFEDGSSDVIRTDSTWKSAPSPIAFNGIRNGEHFDARLDKPDWHMASFDDSEWGRAKVIRSPGGCLEAMEIDPIHITDTVNPVTYWQTPEGAHIFDTGQNMAGIAEITVEGAAGDEIVIRYSERLNKDGVHINQGTVAGFVKSGDFQTDRYIKASDDQETYRPRFVYHGFQYIEISGCKNKPEIKAHVMHSDVADSGHFSSDNDTLNAIQHAARQSTLSNLHSLPTDSPHREKNAWTGDASLSAEQMLFNFHAAPLLRKWLADVRDAQRPDGALPCVVPSTGWGYNWGNGPDWSSAITHIPWQIYLYTGNERVLEENYETATRYFQYMERMAEGWIVHYGIGDWCPPFEGSAVAARMGAYKSPLALTDTGYFYNAADTIARMASVLGLHDDERDYRSAAVSIKQAFRAAFYDAKAHRVEGDCQTATACMIYQGLLEDGEENALLNVLLQQIVDMNYHQDTGILGNKYIYNVLGDAGRMDVALKMILNESFPSYRYWMDQGATTLWECWNGEGSRNHHMFSDISASLYKYLGGIKPDEREPGFKHIVLKPAVDCGVQSVKCHHESPFGRIKSHWDRTDDVVTLDIQIPGGCHASLELPSDFDKVDYPRKLSSGTHQVDVVYQKPN